MRLGCLREVFRAGLALFLFVLIFLLDHFAYRETRLTIILIEIDL